MWSLMDVVISCGVTGLSLGFGYTALLCSFLNKLFKSRFFFSLLCEGMNMTF